jgi:imidazolonepropionase-like amidohydrolase
MRLYQSGALLTGARNELIRRGGVLVDGPRIVAAGPLDILLAEYPLPADVVDLGDVTLLPGLVDVHVHLGFDGGPGPVARMRAETDTEQLILMLRSARELLSVGVTTARDLGARSRKYGSDFDPAVADEIAAAGIYVCPTMNAHALALRERFGDALEKVIMGLYSGGVQIIAGTDAGIDNCPHDAYISVLSYLELVGARGVEHPPAPYRDRRPAGPPPSGLLPNGLLPMEPSSGPLGREPFPSGPPPGAEPAVAGPAAAASALATPAGPSSR